MYNFYTIKKLSILCLILLIMGACAKEQSSSDIPRWSHFPITIYTDNATEKELEDLRAAIDYWNEKAGSEIIRHGGDPSHLTKFLQEYATNPLIDRNEISKQSLDNKQGKTTYARTILTTINNNTEIARGVIYFNQDIPSDRWFHGNGNEKNRISYRKVMAHELGHFIGISEHSNDEHNIMYNGNYHNGNLNGFGVDIADLDYRLLH